MGEHVRRTVPQKQVIRLVIVLIKLVLITLKGTEAEAVYC